MLLVITFSEKIVMGISLILFSREIIRHIKLLFN